MDSKSFKKMMKAIDGLTEERNISKEDAIEIIKDAYVRAYKKDIERMYRKDDKKRNSQKANSKYAELGELNVVAELNEKNKSIDLYQVYQVLESDDDVQDDELEIGLEEAKEFDPNAVVGGTIRRLIENPNLSRADVSIAKNVTRQKVSELNKSAVYEEYKDKKDEMLQGVIESVKDKFTLVNLGRTVALMPHSAHIPHEILREGDKIRVVITEVNKETKGSQVLVSRADPMLVRRLFEREVPEFKDGLIEIKAIARDAGDRTKMAVMSHTDVDAVGACIGPHGQRVQNVIDELGGMEKIDIFEYSSDITELVKNALAPAEIKAVLPGKDENSLLVIVDEDQLSLAIGKRGKNARLAVKLTSHKIDIKTRAELEEAGEDYEELLRQSDVLKQKQREKVEKENEAKRLKEVQAIEERKLADAEKLALLKEQAPTAEEDDFIPEEMMETLNENIQTEIDLAEENEDSEVEKSAVAPVVSQDVVNDETDDKAPVSEAEEETAEEDTAEEVVEDIVEEKKINKHADLEEMAANNTYVSKFEKLADAGKSKQETKFKKKFKKKGEEDNYKLSNKELAEQLKDKLAKHATPAQPIYSEEELEEIEAEREAEEEREYDIDYDEYEDYYDEDN